MPQPTPDWDQVELRGKLVGSDGIPVRGRIKFTLTAGRLKDLDELTDIVGRTVTANIDTVTGAFSIMLQATDDTDITPAGALYLVTEDFEGALPPFYIAVPLAAKVAGLEYTLLSPEGFAPGDLTPSYFAEIMAARQDAIDSADAASLSETAAAGSAGAAGDSETASAGSAAAALASKVAAAGSATTAATKAGEAVTSAAAAEAARAAAVVAKTGSETARTGSETARTGAETARMATEAARDEVAAFQASLGALDHGTQTTVVTIDSTVAAKHQVVLGGNVTATIAMTAGRGDVALRVKQDATGGRSLTLPGVTMPSGFAMPSAPNAEVVITFVRWPDATIFGYPVSLVLIDATNPTAPTGLSATPSSTSVLLEWTAGTDNVAITGYEYRIGAGAWTNAGLVLSKNVTGLTAATAYTFEVRSYDAAGNKSAAASVSTTTAYSYSVVVNDTFTAADGTLVNAHAPDTGPSTLWNTVNAAYTIVGNRFYTNLLDNTQADSNFVDTGGKIMRVTLDYDLTEQKVGNNSNVRVRFWIGGIRTGTYSTRDTGTTLMVKKNTYNASVAALTTPSTYSSPADTMPLTAAGGHDLAALPLTGTLVVETFPDDTFTVKVNGVLWATGSKVVDPSTPTPGTVTVGSYASVGIFGAKAYIDNAKIEHGS